MISESTRRPVTWHNAVHPLGFARADHLRTELVADALANAVAARDPAPGVIFHSDRGCPVHLRRLRRPRRRLPGHPVRGPQRPVLR